MKLSPQQANFVAWAERGTGSCVLEAVAGAGKTTTLLTAIECMGGDIAILAYNKKIAEEIKAKLRERGITHADAGTVHSFGFAAYRKTYKHVRVDGDKVRNITERMFSPQHSMALFFSMVNKLVSLAKQRALIDEAASMPSNWRAIAEHFDIFETRDNGPVPEAQIIDAAICVLRESTKITDTIDFDDMVYMPLALYLPFYQYDVVMIDEAQDTNPARRLLVRRLVRQGGRVIAVGDRHQAIYGFTGADNDSLDLIAKDFNCSRLPLTTTYRCPKSVVKFSQQWVNHIQAHPSAPEGSVSTITMEDFLTLTSLSNESSVLCRNTKPLVALALLLIRNRIACRVEGRDIAANLKKLINRWRVKSLHKLADKLDTYLEQQTKKLLEKRQDAKLQIVEDTVETVRVIVARCLEEGHTELSSATDFIDTLFADDVKDMLVLSTIHKSKGREWQNVYWLDRAGTCPSKYAKQEWMKQQESNLCYVAATRAKENLIELFPAVTSPKASTVKAAPVAKGRLTGEERKEAKRERARKRREKNK